MRSRPSNPCCPSPADAAQTESHDPSEAFAQAAQPGLSRGSARLCAFVLGIFFAVTSLLLAGAAIASDASGDEDFDENAGPRAFAVYVDEAPLIDGDLSDPVWDKARVIDEFTQVEPKTGAAPSYRTETRVLTDGDTLFVSFRAYDPEPEKIVANRMARTETFFYDDGFNVLLDTFHDRQNGYFFQVNPNSGRRDATFDGDNYEENWDGIWYAEAQIDDEGWTAEFAIPFKTLGFREGDDVWGLNLSRRIRRFNEDIRWADPTIERIIINVSRAGTLHGMSVARQGVGLDVVPSITAGSTHTNCDGRPAARAMTRFKSGTVSRSSRASMRSIACFLR